jgi:hypothetical protein
VQINLLDDDGWLAPSQESGRPGYRWRRKRVAGERLAAGLCASLSPAQ